MEKRKLVTIPDTRLRETASPVTNQDISELVEEMSRIRQENGGIGIAAPQVGELLRVINVLFRGREVTIVNPVILHKKGKQVIYEGCLSLPGKLYRTTKSQKLTVIGADIYGKQIKLKCREDEAPVLEHEIDHLDGIMIDEKGTLVAEFKPVVQDKLAFSD